MKPIFTSEDISTLVAVFPSTPPTKNCPSLVQGLTSEALLDSRKVLARFQSLLRLSPTRIRVSHLSRQLNTAHVDWLLECHGDFLLYSKDNQSLIPDLEQRRLEKTFRELDFTALEQLADRNDVSLHGAERLMQRIQKYDPGAILEHSKDHTIFYYSPAYARKTKDAIRSAILDSGGNDSDIVNIGAISGLQTLPTSFMQQMSEEVATDERAVLGGKIELKGPQVRFVPANYGDLEKERRHQNYQNEVKRLVDQISQDGYCIIAERSEGDTETLPESSFHEDLVSRYCQIYSQGDDLTTIPGVDVADQGPSMMIKHATLRKLLEDITRSAIDRVEELWRRRDGSQKESAIIDDAMQSACRSSGRSSDCSSILLSSHTHMDPIRHHLKTRLQELGQADATDFQNLLQQHLLAEIHLYATGLATVSDPTLKANLEEYIGEDLRRYTVPETVKLLRERSLLLDKSRARDVDRFQQACNDARTLIEIQTAAEKLARKQKVQSPPSSVLREIRMRTLEEKIKAMRKNTTGSFLLQNLTWILLSQAVQRSRKEATFMSAGKDTTRMIKHYHTIGDVELGMKLTQWRDLLKKGGESAKDLEDMRELAEKAVDDMETDVELLRAADDEKK